MLDSDSDCTGHQSSAKPHTVQSFISNQPREDKDSDVTSNLDSIDSFLALKVTQKIDLQLMTAQLNADQFSTEHLQNVGMRPTPKRFQINRQQTPSNFSFVNKKASSAVKLDKRELLPKITAKYTDEESLISSRQSSEMIQVVQNQSAFV